MDIHALHAGGRYRDPNLLILDVRSAREYRLGHVPGSYNVPIDTLARAPARYVPGFAPFHEVVVHCSSGQRARRAVELLHTAGLENLTLVDGGGMPEWRRRGYPVERGIALKRDLMVGLAAGLVAQLAVAGVEHYLRSRIGTRQKIRERIVRRGSPHEVAQEKFGPAFPFLYSLAWGAIHALARRRVPASRALLGLPFGVAFFLACDGLIAPLFRMSPGLHRIPAPFNAKELANHVAWTAAAEAVHRGAERLPR